MSTFFLLFPRIADKLRMVLYNDAWFAGSGAPDRTAAARKCARFGESRVRTATPPARNMDPDRGGCA